MVTCTCLCRGSFFFHHYHYTNFDNSKTQKAAILAAKILQKNYKTKIDHKNSPFLYKNRKGEN